MGPDVKRVMMFNRMLSPEEIVKLHDSMQRDYGITIEEPPPRRPDSIGCILAILLVADVVWLVAIAVAFGLFGEAAF